MNQKEKLLELCEASLVQKGFKEDRYVKRLNSEIQEINAQNECDYFFSLYEKKVKFQENENNLLVPYLLGIVDDFNKDEESNFITGDSPDVDVDFLPMLRSHLKDVWAPETFGVNKVCNITSYNTFGIKNALIDIVRVYGKSRQEILDITTKIEPKDEDGKEITWDKALEIYPELKKYCDNNPDVAKAAKKLLHRSRGMGKHAGGLIISSVPLDEFIPLVKDKDDNPTSSWVEGLHGQDLGPMGLVKFDVLGISNLMQIAIACKLIKERHNLPSICAFPGQKDWSDDSYLNDPKVLAMANKGDLKCIFQFDSDGIRKLVKDGGVTSFDDLVAYSALYRPGCMQMKMHTTYVERKKGNATFTIHPLLQSILGNTYGVIIFQEQCMKILHVVGDIPLKDCEILRKAISKKNESYFAQYKERFIVNGQKNLGFSKEEVENIWQMLAAFSTYAFNLSHSCCYSVISARLLWLKSHYPLEFFTAILTCEEAQEKIKEYKIEASRYGIEILPVDLNQSKENFHIVGNKIYYGFSKVKGIGEAVSKRIVEGQPYVDFVDFLDRFGTDGTVIKPLVGLRLFGNDPVNKYKFYTWYKDIKQKKENSNKRFVKGSEDKINSLKELLPESLHHLAIFTETALDQIREEYHTNKDLWLSIMDIREIRFQKEIKDKLDKLKELLPESLHHLAVFTSEALAQIKSIIYPPFTNANLWTDGENKDLDSRIQWQDEDGMEYYLFDDIEALHKSYNKAKLKTPLEEIEALFKAYNKSISNKEKKPAEEIDLSSFNPEEIEIDQKLADMYSTIDAGEKAFYGFLWTHPLEKSPDYEGNMTFEAFRIENVSVGPVEIQLLSVEEKISAKKTKYWLLTTEDVNSEVGLIQVWEDDYERFKDELVAGKMMRMRVRAPSGGFSRYTFDSPPRHQRHSLPKNKENDHRIFVMKVGENV